VVLLGSFIGHSAFIRFHEYTGLSQTIVMNETPDQKEGDRLASSAIGHLTTADRWGLIHNERVENGLLDASLRLHRYQDVEKYARQLLRHTPGDGTVHLRLAQSLAGRERNTEAETELGNAITLLTDIAPAPPELGRAHQAFGEILAREGRFSAAIEELRAALVLDPQRGAVHAELGGALAELGQFDSAIASMREAVRLDPSLAQAHYNLGTILAHEHQFELAVSSYQRALDRGFEDSDVQNNLGFALIKIGRMTEAHPHLERAIAIDPNNAKAHFNLGTLFAAVQDERQADEQFRIAARLDARFAKLLSE
jgi:tetratricopeptide (TPR) repeat protein